MAAPRRLILSVDGADRDAIGVLDDLDKQVFMATSWDACYACGISGSAIGTNFAIGIDHFESLAGPEASLPMKIVRREDRALLALRMRGETSQEENQGHANHRRYPSCSFHTFVCEAY